MHLALVIECSVCSKAFIEVVWARRIFELNRKIPNMHILSLFVLIPIPLAHIISSHILSQKLLLFMMDKPDPLVDKSRTGLLGMRLNSNRCQI